MTAVFASRLAATLTPSTALRPPAFPAAVGTPFDLADDARYQRWRDAKLRQAPASAEALIVDVADPRALTAAEHGALADRCARANMALYRCTGSRCATADKHLARDMGRQFGLHRLDANWLADEDGISPITVSDHRGGPRSAFIPYTDRAIRWHTDGYYHPAGRTIHAMILHCAASAAAGGTNALLDHELAYIALRDANPDGVAALMAPDAMTIPERTDEDGVARAAQSGPVFSVDATGALHMRYTARSRSIAWKDDGATRAAVALLADVLATSPYILRVRLAPGMGIVCNNVLHDREAFTDDPARPRLLYRARYLDRIDAGPKGPSAGATH